MIKKIKKIYIKIKKKSNGLKEKIEYNGKEKVKNYDDEYNEEYLSDYGNQLIVSGEDSEDGQEKKTKKYKRKK